MWERLDAARGVEADIIAQSIVAGHGFSFPGDHRWLFDRWNGDPDSYFPTAWADPVYTYTLAAAHWVFDEHAYAAMYGLDVLCVVVILICAYQIGRRFGGPWTGTLAVLLIAMHHRLGTIFFETAITHTVVAAAVIMLAALMIIRYIEHPSPKRLIAAGLITGLMVLLTPTLQYFLPLLPLLLIVVHWRDWQRAAIHAVTMTLLAALVLTPWAIRNYVTFDEVVVVRTGGGQMAWLSTVAAAETFMPGAAGSHLAAPGESDNAIAAVFTMRDQSLRREMHRYQVASQEGIVPGFEDMNEAQRDKLYLSQTTAFIRDHPYVAAQMAVAKLYIYLRSLGNFGLAIVALAGMGALLSVRDPRSWPLSLLALSFSAIFILIIAFYPRYRAPIEPLLTVLGAIGIALLVSRFTARFGVRTRAEPSPASDLRNTC